MTNFAVPYFNTGTHPLEKMVCRQPKSFLDILPKTPFLLIVALSPKSGNGKLKRLSNKLKPYRDLLQPTTMHMLNPSLRLRSELMSPSKAPAPNCGISMASSQPFHQTEDITSKPPVAECWLETVDSYAEESPFLYHYHQVPHARSSHRPTSSTTPPLYMGQVSNQASH